MPLHVFGLTGGIGSGKSEVAKRLQQRGLPVVNADHLARLAVVPGSVGLAELVQRFGPEVLTSAGELDRVGLGERVFGNPEARAALDAIVHPIVRQLAAEHFERISQRGEALACYEVPLLYEVGLERTISPVVVVNASEASRRARLTVRDGFDEAQINARLAAQMPLAEKVRRADYVIDNAGSLTALREHTDAVFDVLCAALSVPPERYAPPHLS